MTSRPHEGLSDREWAAAVTSAASASGRLTFDWYVEHLPAFPPGDLPSSVTSAAVYPLWVEEVIRQVRTVFDLQDGWDSYGAQSVSVEAVDNMMDLLLSIMRPGTPAPAVVPTVDGRLQIEWHLHGLDLEVEILSATRFHAYFYDEQQQVESWENTLTSDLRKLSRAIFELSRRSGN